MTSGLEIPPTNLVCHGASSTRSPDQSQPPRRGRPNGVGGDLRTSCLSGHETKGAPSPSESLRTRLMAGIAGPWSDPDIGRDDCWDWTAKWRSRYGYGRLRESGHNGRQLQAHVAMYLLQIGPYPAGMVLDHRCRRPVCCNPAHLEPVTVATNNLRRFRPAPTIDAREFEDYLERCELEAEAL